MPGHPSSGNVAPAGSGSPSHAVIDPTQLQRLQVTLGCPPSVWRAGDPIPPGWHHVFFPPLVATSALGADGLAPGPDPAAISPGTRQMLVGIRSAFLAPVRVGQLVTRTSELVGMTQKQGRSGPVRFATYRHVVSIPEGVAVEDEWRTVTIPAMGQEGATAPSSSPVAMSAPDWQVSVSADAATLFRFAAVTFNAHRIHFDVHHARVVEGYPDLVVPATWTALHVLEAARLRLHAPIRHVSIQARAPAFAGQVLVISGVGRPGGCDIRIVGPQGVLVAEAAIDTS